VQPKSEGMLRKVAVSAVEGVVTQASSLGLDVTQATKEALLGVG
jgi:hypothetical protein